LLVVPEPGQFAQVEASLNANQLASIVSSMTTERVFLSMPRFKIETTLKLRELLKQLGMTMAFSAGEADFSGMDGTRNLYIADAFHKAYIDVAEKGTEAAAATAVVLKDASMPMVDLYVNVDHPFLYFLRDEPTGAILFMGRVLDPSK
jgi:serpin B